MSLVVIDKKIARLGGPLREEDSDLVKRRKAIWMIMSIAGRSLDALHFTNGQVKEQAYTLLVKAAQRLEAGI